MPNSTTRATGSPPGGTCRSRPCALDQLHGQEAGAVLVLDREQRDDVRVVEAGDRARLVLEAGEAVGVGGDVGGKHLERHIATEPTVPGAVHLAHSARAERADDLVVAETGTCDQRHRGSLPQVGFRARAPPRRRAARDWAVHFRKHGTIGSRPTGTTRCRILPVASHRDATIREQIEVIDESLTASPGRRNLPPHGALPADSKSASRYRSDSSLISSNGETEMKSALSLFASHELTSMSLYRALEMDILLCQVPCAT